MWSKVPFNADEKQRDYMPINLGIKGKRGQIWDAIKSGT